MKGNVAPHIKILIHRNNPEFEFYNQTGMKMVK